MKMVWIHYLICLVVLIVLFCLFLKKEGLKKALCFLLFVVMGWVIVMLAWFAIDYPRWRAAHQSAEPKRTHASALAMPVQAISQTVLPEENE